MLVLGATTETMMSSPTPTGETLTTMTRPSTYTSTQRRSLPEGSSHASGPTKAPSPPAVSLPDNLVDAPGILEIKDSLPHLFRLWKLLFWDADEDKNKDDISLGMIQNLVLIMGWMKGESYKEMIEKTSALMPRLTEAAAGMRLRRLSIRNKKVRLALEIGRAIRNNPLRKRTSVRSKHVCNTSHTSRKWAPY